MQTDEKAIRQLVRDWMMGTIEKDVPRIAALMAEDVIFLVTSHPLCAAAKLFSKALKECWAR
jgi:ketosteroid isomerase-like protein